MHFTRILPIIAASLFGVTAYAANTPDVYIFKAGSLSAEGLTVGGWGSGKASESKVTAMNGGFSVKITTQSLYAGGRIELKQPVALYTAKPEEDRYLVFAFYFDDKKQVDPAAGTNNDIEADAYFVPNASKVRFVFVNDKGGTQSIEQPTTKIDDDNWMRIAIPLSKFKHAEGETEYKLSKFIISTDIPATLYFGELKMTTDKTPITVDVNGMQDFGVNTKAFFLASAYAGITALDYSWDFDAENGIQKECTGMVGSHSFKLKQNEDGTTSGDYIITVTVSDKNGVKKPVTATYKVSVNG
ncbi:MAG: hypothetical protein NT018_03205 [Armatimonadetes bacterium]|nr:hypothetical protein [Armatimonadota bacterium]